MFTHLVSCRQAGKERRWDSFVGNLICQPTTRLPVSKSLLSTPSLPPSHDYSRQNYLTPSQIGIFTRARQQFKRTQGQTVHWFRITSSSTRPTATLLSFRWYFILIDGRLQLVVFWVSLRVVTVKFDVLSHAWQVLLHHLTKMFQVTKRNSSQVWPHLVRTRWEETRDIK